MITKKPFKSEMARPSAHKKKPDDSDNSSGSDNSGNLTPVKAKNSEEDKERSEGSSSGKRSKSADKDDCGITLLAPRENYENLKVIPLLEEVGPGAQRVYGSSQNIGTISL